MKTNKTLFLKRGTNSSIIPLVNLIYIKNIEIITTHLARYKVNNENMTSQR